MQPDSPDFNDRLARIRAKLLTADLDALLFFDMKNIRYLTGFTGSDGALVLKRGRDAALLVDGRYVTQAHEEALQAEIIEYRDKIEGIVSALGNGASQTVGFEAAAISFEAYKNLEGKAPDLKLAPLSGDSDIRTVKDEYEIALMREAARIASRSLAEILDKIKPGAREMDVALELDYRMRQNGAAGMSFSTIVAAGANSALPHACPGTRKLSPGDGVVIDYGVLYEGYHSDETCTFFLGRSSPRQKEVYAAVKEAHDRALASVKAGVPCCEIDRIARGCIEANGLGRFFSHGTGHGIGLQIHEPPRIAAPSKAILEAGMVITIEPGVYIPGLWGVRIEDTVLVKDGGFEVLSKTPKDLTVLAV